MKKKGGVGIVILVIVIIIGLGIGAYFIFSSKPQEITITSKLCNERFPLETFNRCVHNIAGEQANSKLCEQLKEPISEDEREGCYSIAYINDLDFNSCYSLNLRAGDCISAIAIRKRDKKLCEEAVSVDPSRSLDGCTKYIDCMESYSNGQVLLNDCISKI